MVVVVVVNLVIVVVVLVNLVIVVVLVYAKPTNLAGPINKLQDMK